MYRTQAIALSIAIALGTHFPVATSAAEAPAQEPTATLTSADAPLGLFKVMRITLDNAPKLKLQRMKVDAASAQEQMAGGSFDINTTVVAGYQNTGQTNWVLDELTPEHRAPFPAVWPNHDTRNKDIPYLVMGAGKKFRTGISTDLSVTMQRIDDRQTIPRMPPTVTSNTTQVKFSVKIPLLKGAGRVSAAAQETTARLNRQASVSSLQHSLTAIMLDSIKAYWDYKRSTVYLKQVKKALDRVDGWVDQVGSSNANLQAYLENTKGKLTDAQQDLEEKRIALAQAMGIPASETAKMGTPVTDIPLDWDNVLASFDKEALGKAWQEVAIANRLDLKAAKLQLEAAGVQQAKARKDRLPRLNLDLSIGYAGFKHYNAASDFFGSFNSNIPRTDNAASLTFAYPIGNNTAEGVYALRNVGYQQALIGHNEAQRGVRLSIGRSVSNVYGRLQKTVQMNKTVSSYEEAVKGMQGDSKYIGSRNGLATLIDTEEKFLTSVEDFSFAVVDLAKAIAETRFNTGTLITVSEDIDAEADVKMEQIISLPNM